MNAAAEQAAKRPPTVSLAQLEAQLAEPSVVPACRPYEAADYLKRVGTFRPSAQWFDKPAALSPPQCARYGWTLQAHDLLTCEVCSGCLKAPSTLTSRSAADETVAVVVKQLTSAHAQLCPWRGNASPPTIASLLLPGHYGTPPSLPHGVSIGREALRLRAVSLLPLASLPKLAPACDDYWQACASACGFAEVGTWQDACLALTAPSSRGAAAYSAGERERRWAAVALAMLGWAAAPTTASSGAVKDGTIECIEDARTVGLWQFEPLSPQAAAAPSTATPAEMDPVAEHRVWSPWLEVVEGDSMPAWMRLIALLLPAAAAGGRADAGPSAANASAAISKIIAAF